MKKREMWEGSIPIVCRLVCLICPLSHSPYIIIVISYSSDVRVRKTKEESIKGRRTNRRRVVCCLYFWYNYHDNMFVIMVEEVMEVVVLINCMSLMIQNHMVLWVMGGIIDNMLMMYRVRCGCREKVAYLQLPLVVYYWCWCCALRPASCVLRAVSCVPRPASCVLRAALRLALRCSCCCL